MMNYDHIPSNKRGKVRRRDQKIVAAWNMFEEVEPDISTERLMAQVGDFCHVDAPRICDALQRFDQQIARLQSMKQQKG